MKMDICLPGHYILEFKLNSIGLSKDLSSAPGPVQCLAKATFLDIKVNKIEEIFLPRFVQANKQGSSENDGKSDDLSKLINKDLQRMMVDPMFMIV